MTDCYTDRAALAEEGKDIHRSLLWLLLARVLLAAGGIYLVFFLLQWSSAVKRDTVFPPKSQYVPALQQTQYVQWHTVSTLPGQHVPDEWKVVIPIYAGTGRGSTLVALKPWKFGTMQEHPLAVAGCVAAMVLMAAAFAVCTWSASRLKRLEQR
jgi:hypothetical protein